MASPCEPAIDERDFKASMARLVFSIAIVTARRGDEEIGRTVTSFMPLSAEPPRIMISIDVRSRLIDVIGASKTFSLSFLASRHQEVGDTFAGKWGLADRFTTAEWDSWPSGNRKLASALLAFDCELMASVDVDDHMLFVGTITQADHGGDHGKLLWSERSYMRLEPSQPDAGGRR
jgi:flavin reductase (DIM6/NTAB) family NADH-FMN oxidoreductase RutF